MPSQDGRELVVKNRLPVPESIRAWVDSWGSGTAWQPSPVFLPGEVPWVRGTCWSSDPAVSGRDMMKKRLGRPLGGGTQQSAAQGWDRESGSSGGAHAERRQSCKGVMPWKRLEEKVNGRAQRKSMHRSGQRKRSFVKESRGGVESEKRAWIVFQRTRKVKKPVEVSTVRGGPSGTGPRGCAAPSPVCRPARGCAGQEEASTDKAKEEHPSRLRRWHLAGRAVRSRELGCKHKGQMKDNRGGGRAQGKHVSLGWVEGVA